MTLRLVVDFGLVLEITRRSPFGELVELERRPEIRTLKLLLGREDSLDCSLYFPNLDTLDLDVDRDDVSLGEISPMKLVCNRSVLPVIDYSRLSIIIIHETINQTFVDKLKKTSVKHLTVGGFSEDVIIDGEDLLSLRQISEYPQGRSRRSRGHRQLSLRYLVLRELCLFDTDLVVWTYECLIFRCPGRSSRRVCVGDRVYRRLDVSAQSVGYL